MTREHKPLRPRPGILGSIKVKPAKPKKEEAKEGSAEEKPTEDEKKTTNLH